MDKKVLLIHPVLESNANHTLVYRKGYGTAIPLGLAYIGAELIKNNYAVKVFDFQVATTNLYHEIETFNPDIIGISVCTPASKISFKLAGDLKHKYPDIPIIAGGPHITTLKKDIFLSTEHIDFLVIGEGEETIVELINEIFGGQRYHTVQGICYKSNSEILENKARNFLVDIDKLPLLPLELFDYSKYVPTPGTFVHLPNVAFLSTRGCPYSCIFCNKSMFGSTLRQMSADRIIDEIIYLKDKYAIREINFYDDTFTVNKARVFEFCEKLIQRNVSIKWKCNSRVNTVTKEMLHLMKKAGCFSISFGVESGDDRILKKIKKGINTDQVRQAFKWSREAGISRSAFFMLNLPGDTIQSTEKTIKFSREIKPDFVSFELTKPLPGTAIRETLKNEKNVRIFEELWNDWESCTISNKVFFTQNDLTKDYLIDAFNRAVKSFYITPQFLIKSFFKIRSLKQFQSYFFAALNICFAKIK